MNAAWTDEEIRHRVIERTEQRSAEAWKQIRELHDRVIRLQSAMLAIESQARAAACEIENLLELEKTT